MRLQKLLPVILVIAGLAIGIAWCAGPCCAGQGAAPSALSIGAVSCCGAGTPSRCQPSIQRADAAAVSSIAAAHSPLVLSTAPVAPDALATASGPRAPGPAMLIPRQGFSAHHTPLLI
jgi:hypothetical protein